MLNVVIIIIVLIMAYCVITPRCMVGIYALGYSTLRYTFDDMASFAF